MFGNLGEEMPSFLLIPIHTSTYVVFYTHVHVHIYVCMYGHIMYILYVYVPTWELLVYEVRKKNRLFVLTITAHDEVTLNNICEWSYRVGSVCM